MSTTSERSYDDDRTQGWAAGVVVFAGVLLITVATFQVLQGLAAILEDDVYVTGIKYAYEIDLTTWGWIHLLVGAIGVIVGLSLLSGQTWARVAGIVIAALGAIANFAFLPYYPFWSMLIIAFNVLVVWAIATQMRNA